MCVEGNTEIRKPTVLVCIWNVLHGLMNWVLGPPGCRDVSGGCGAVSRMLGVGLWRLCASPSSAVVYASWSADLWPSQSTKPCSLQSTVFSETISDQSSSSHDTLVGMLSQHSDDERRDREIKLPLRVNICRCSTFGWPCSWLQVKGKLLSFRGPLTILRDFMEVHALWARTDLKLVGLDPVSSCLASSSF